MRKHIDSVLYGLTVMYCFLITGLGMGDSSDIISYIGKRAVFLFGGSSAAYHSDVTV